MSQKPYYAGCADALSQFKVAETTLTDAIRGAKDAVKSDYNYLRDLSLDALRQPNFRSRDTSDEELKKQITDRRQSTEGLLASVLGRVNAAPTAFLMSPKDPMGWLNSMSPEDAARVLKYMKARHGDSLSTTAIRLGGSHTLDDMRRAWRNERTTLPEKLLGVLAAPFQNYHTVLNRADHYNPLTDTVGSYSGNPHVLAHELGHAADYNQKTPIHRALYTFAGPTISTVSRAIGKTPRAGQIGDALSALYTLWPEAQASLKARQGLELADGDRSEQGRQLREVLYPAYGSYLGNALRSVASAATGKALPGATIYGMGAGHAAAHLHNALSPDAPSDAKAETP